MDEPNALNPILLRYINMRRVDAILASADNMAEEWRQFQLLYLTRVQTANLKCLQGTTSSLRQLPPELRTVGDSSIASYLQPWHRGDQTPLDDMQLTLDQLRLFVEVRCVPRLMAMLQVYSNAIDSWVADPEMSNVRRYAMELAQEMDIHFENLLEEIKPILNAEMWRYLHPSREVLREPGMAGLIALQFETSAAAQQIEATEATARQLHERCERLYGRRFR